MAAAKDEKKRALNDPLMEQQPFEAKASFEWTEMNTMVAIGWPMLVSFFCRMGMASADSAFVGHITNGSNTPAEYLAAAGLSDMVTNILIIPPLAFNQSLNALVSQAIGSGNKKIAGTWLQLSVFSLTLAYIPCLVSFFYVAPILRILGFSETLCTLAGTFAKYNVFWPIPNGWYQCMRFYFQAQGISRPAMYNNIVFLGVNILLNWIFVFGGPFRAWFGWNGLGFIGAAISLSVSRSSQPLTYWLYMFVYRKAHLDTWPGWSFGFLQRERVKSFMDQSLPQVGTLILQAAIGQTTTLLIAQLGPLAIAASSAATAFTQIFTGGLSATLNAVSGIRVGFHLGAGQGDRARRASWIIFKMSSASVGLLAVLILPFGRSAMSVMTSDTDVQNLGALLLPAVLLNTFAGLIVNCTTGGIFTSQGRTKLATFLSMGVELPLSIGSVAALVLVLHQNLVVVYWVQALVMCFEMFIVMIIFFRSDWKQYARDAQRRQEANTATIFSASPHAADIAATLGTPARALRSPASFGSPGAQKQLMEFDAPSATIGDADVDMQGAEHL